MKNKLVVLCMFLSFVLGAARAQSGPLIAVKPGQKVVKKPFPDKVFDEYFIVQETFTRADSATHYRFVRGYKDPEDAWLLWAYFNDIPVPVTGMIQYPVGFELLECHLENWITEDLKKSFTYESKSELYKSQGIATHSARLVMPTLQRGMRVLSLGEGTSGLLPFLRDKGVEAYGLDLIYFSPLPGSLFALTSEELEKYAFISWYENKYREFLIAGDATRLSTIADPAAKAILKPGSFDVVMSHKVFMHLVSPTDQENLIREAVRMLKPGATAIITDVGRSLVAIQSGGVVPLLDMLSKIRKEQALSYEIIKTSSSIAIKDETYEALDDIWHGCYPKSEEMGDDPTKCFTPLLQDLFPFLTREDIENKTTNFSDIALINLFPEELGKPKRYPDHLSDYTLILQKAVQ